MKRAYSGFTLAELLIALALLGVIAAFTIPKVLNAAGTTENASKFKETVATLEGAFYEVKMRNLVTAGTLYANLQPRINAVNNAATSPAAAGGPYAGVAGGHPCALAPLNNSANGWLQFQNGVVVSGLADGTNLDTLPWNDAGHLPADNYVICIDVNGAAAPNRGGTDIFIGGFNQFGAFTAAPAAETQKSFNWGGAVPIQAEALATDLGTNAATNISGTASHTSHGAVILVQQ